MSINRDQTKRNVITAIVEVVVTGVVLFLVYSVVVRKLSLEHLGGWSILSAITGAARIGEAGFAAAPVRFVSRFRARNENKIATFYGQTAIITVAALMTVILALSAWPIARVLHATVRSEILDELIVLIPLALLGTWMLSVSSAVQSCLDGAERVDLRTYIQILGVIVFFGAVLLLVPNFGLAGLAWSLVIQGLTVLSGSILIAGRIIGLSWPWKWRWSRSAFRDMFSYGVNLQISSIAVVLFEPVTKILLARFADLSTVGVFEMVSRLVNQVRSLLTAANRALVPVYARIAEVEPRKSRGLFNATFRASLFIALPIFGGLVIFSPDIGRIWIGEPRQEFVWLAAIVCLGRLINTLVAPAYFANLGQGHPAPNALGHAVTSTANMILGALAATFLGGVGIAWAYTVSIVLGSVLIQAAFMKRNLFPVSALLPSVPMAVLIGVSLAAGLAAVSPGFLFDQLWVGQIVFVLVALCLLIWEYQTSALFRRLLLGYGKGLDQTI